MSQSRNILRINTRILMMTSSVFYGFTGIGLTFFSEEIAQYSDIGVNQNLLFIFQLTGAVYVGFAMLNWITRNNLVGGIYSRSLVIGNLTHFLAGSFALITIAFYSKNSTGIILTLIIIYAAFALSFGYILMTNPGKIPNGEQ